MSERETRTECEMREKLDELRENAQAHGRDLERRAQIRALRWALKETTTL